MIRFLLRIIGLFALAGGFVAILYDGMNTIAVGEVIITSMGDVVRKMHPAALPRLEAFVAQFAPGWGMQAISTLFLRPPAALVLLVLGALLMVLGRKPQPRGPFVR